MPLAFQSKANILTEPFRIAAHIRLSIGRSLSCRVSVVVVVAIVKYNLSSSWVESYIQKTDQLPCNCA